MPVPTVDTSPLQLSHVAWVRERHLLHHDY